MTEPPRYSPFVLIGILVLVMLGFALFFVGFLIAPAAVLVIFYIGLITRERTRGEKTAAGSSQNAQAEASARAVLLKREAEARERQARREAEAREQEEEQGRQQEQEPQRDGDAQRPGAGRGVRSSPLSE